MKLPALAAAVAALDLAGVVHSFTHPGATIQHGAPIIHRRTTHLGMTIVSPFANTTDGEDDDLEGDAGVATATYTPLPSDDEPLDLTWDNVDMVLDEMRPYLLQDGGNVAISEIDGPVVRLELQVSWKLHA